MRPDPSPESRINPLDLAKACRALIRKNYVLVTSCVETSFLFERTAHHLGLTAPRVVCQVMAYSPAMAAAMDTGELVKDRVGEPGFWAVGIGQLQYPEDYVGRLEPEKNRFVGHVVCLPDNSCLADPSADQMHRPERGLLVPYPVVCRISSEHDRVITRNPEGTVLVYQLHRTVPVPRPRTDKILERMARTLAKSLSAGAHRT